MSTTAHGARDLARRSAWAHRASLTGTFLVLALAGLLLGIAGVLAESGIRRGSAADGPDAGGGLLLLLAGSFSGTVAAVVVLVLVSTVSLSLAGRRRELALLGAIGATRPQLRRMIGVEVLLAGLVATPVGATVGVLLASLLSPLLRESGAIGAAGTLWLSPLPVLGATALVLPVAWLAARLAARETLRRAPGHAVRSSTVETRTLGAVRRAAALTLAATGLAAAGSPLVVPGTVGGASAASSALLLVAAAALAGPLLVGHAFGHTARWEPHLGPAAGLAVANLRGFSRRLSVVVVPLALTLTAGTAQTTVDRTVAETSRVQLLEGLEADLVVTPEAGSGADVAAIASVAGVESTTTLADVAARVLTDPDLDGVIDALAWEPTTVRVLGPGATWPLLDPGVSTGSLGDLTHPDTVAVSSDAALVGGFDLDDTVALRWPDGTTSRPTVVAVYESGLGFGDYLVGSHASTPRSIVDTVLVGTADGTSADVRAELGAQGLTAMDPSSYADIATATGDAERRLSAVLLLGLLGFVMLAAANTLGMATVRRRPELRLYARTGATGRQLVRMTAAEAALTGVLAWLIGTLAAIPTVLGVGLGMLGPVVPPVDLTAYVALSAAVLTLPMLIVVPVTTWLVRQP